MEKQNVFGFSTEPSAGGDFTPIIKYDARAGRIFRVDRVNTGNGFESDVIDITALFKAIVDFENVGCGWIDFPTNSAPSFALAPLGTPLPPRPSTKHKNGIRFILKLNKGCGGEKPVREIAGTSKAFLRGVEEVYEEYKAQKDKYPGQLPVLVLASTVPVVSEGGGQKSTNYQPKFRLDGWAKRPADLVAAPAEAGASPQQTAPSTGSTIAKPPSDAEKSAAMKATAAASDDDFG